ncbi:SDR family oxidoreductase [Streptomyces sp. RPT161]|uniref:SDR family oxidoreductase n=1 Tax=Streptomyces sp. RPT161 TaxID=3015993 RepID=UPI0022B85959|nr:SDR family oxidoreductase [Streptomyces sp. RPT161]
MEIESSTCLVTGANRGVGRVYVRSLLERKARKVYAAARRPETVDIAGAVPIQLDITSPDDVTRVAAECDDVTVVINNAGFVRSAQPLDHNGMEAARAEMETNYFGTMSMCRAFAPVLAVNGGGALVNMLSVTSWFASPINGTYSASKAAGWLLTHAVRRQLRSQGTLVVSVHSTWIDTDMSANVPAGEYKISPEAVVDQVLEAIEDGTEEVLTDEPTRRVKASLPEDMRLYVQ